MTLTTYEVEMNLNALLYLETIIAEFDLISDQTNVMQFYHYELALLRCAYLLKDKPKSDERHSLINFKDLLSGLCVKINKDPLKSILDKIDLFREEYKTDIYKIISWRDVEAHGSKAYHEVLNSKNNSITIQEIIKIIYIIRTIVNELYTVIFGEPLSENIKYDVNIYHKVYLNGIKSLKIPSL